MSKKSLFKILRLSNSEDVDYYLRKHQKSEMNEHGIEGNLNSKKCLISN